MTSALQALPWRQFICKVCGLIYDERLGDADSGLAAGTRFDDIPDAGFVGLTTVRQDVAAQGRAAAEALLAELGLIETRQRGDRTFPVEFVPRTSTAPPRAR